MVGIKNDDNQSSPFSYNSSEAENLSQSRAELMICPILCNIAIFQKSITHDNIIQISNNMQTNFLHRNLNWEKFCRQHTK